MKLILLGAPGAGKGTQAVRLAERLDIPHISTGDIFRKNIKEGTELGKKVVEFTSAGKLVPDELTINLVLDRLAMDDCKNGFLLDGFPRNIAQAEALEKNCAIDKVVNLDADLTKLTARLTGRRVCSECGESHHISTMTADACVKCGAGLVHRNDDKEDTVVNRLNIYTAQTAPLIDFYSKKGKLVSVDGMDSIENVFKSILTVLK